MLRVNSKRDVHLALVACTSLYLVNGEVECDLLSPICLLLKLYALGVTDRLLLPVMLQLWVCEAILKWELPVEHITRTFRLFAIVLFEIIWLYIEI